MFFGNYNEAGHDALDRAPAAGVVREVLEELDVKIPVIDPSGVEDIKRLAAAGNKKAQILLEVSEGSSPVHVGEKHNCSRTRIYYIIKEYTKRGYEYLIVKKGRPSKTEYKASKPGFPRGSKKKGS